MEATLYDQVGGDVALRRLVERFYDRMEQLPQARTVRAMHPEDLTESRDRLFWFLQMWTGGPREPYLERRGHPRLRARHFPFAIDAEARDVWLDCMRGALDETLEDSPLRDELLSAFGEVAEHMRNR